MCWHTGYILNPAGQPSSQQCKTCSQGPESIHFHSLQSIYSVAYEILHICSGLRLNANSEPITLAIKKCPRGPLSDLQGVIGSVINIKANYLPLMPQVGKYPINFELTKQPVIPKVFYVGFWLSCK